MQIDISVDVWEHDSQLQPDSLSAHVSVPDGASSYHHEVLYGSLAQLMDIAVQTRLRELREERRVAESTPKPEPAPVIVRGVQAEDPEDDEGVDIAALVSDWHDDDVSHLSDAALEAEEVLAAEREWYRSSFARPRPNEEAVANATAVAQVEADAARAAQDAQAEASQDSEAEQLQLIEDERQLAASVWDGYGGW